MKADMFLQEISALISGHREDFVIMGAFDEPIEGITLDAEHGQIILEEGGINDIKAAEEEGRIEGYEEAVKDVPDRMWLILVWLRKGIWRKHGNKKTCIFCGVEQNEKQNADVEASRGWIRHKDECPVFNAGDVLDTLQSKGREWSNAIDNGIEDGRREKEAKAKG